MAKKVNPLRQNWKRVQKTQWQEREIGRIKWANAESAWKTCYGKEKNQKNRLEPQQIARTTAKRKGILC